MWHKRSWPWPLVKAVGSATNDFQIGSRLRTLADSLKTAANMTEISRKHNRERLEARANAKEIKVGDSVVVAAAERLALTSRWDPQYEVYQVRGPVCWIRHQRTGKERVITREKLRIVDPNLAWDGIAPRPIRNLRKSVIPPSLFQPPTLGADAPPVLCSQVSPDATEGEAAAGTSADAATDANNTTASRPASPVTAPPTPPLAAPAASADPSHQPPDTADADMDADTPQRGVKRQRAQRAYHPRQCKQRRREADKRAHTSVPTDGKRHKSQ